jgi:pimeloyl-ACP methyl ester carboxylesterase
VHGGNPPTWEDAEWFDPQQWLPYQAIDLQDQSAISEIAYHESVMHVAALQIGRQFPNSITIMIRDDSQVISDLLDAIYRVGDRILLVGHSFGGQVIEELASDLKRRRITVGALVYIESFWSNGSVPNNVKARSISTYRQPSHFVEVWRRSKQRIPSAQRRLISPYRAREDPMAAAGHRNIDSDPRVSKDIFDHIITKIGFQQPKSTRPASWR